MPHQPESFVSHDPIRVPRGCAECEFACAALAEGVAIFRQLKREYGERPPATVLNSHACHVREARHAELVATDPIYAALLEIYAAGMARRNDIRQNCSGGTLVHEQDQPTQHRCGYSGQAEAPEPAPPPQG